MRGIEIPPERQINTCLAWLREESPADVERLERAFSALDLDLFKDVQRRILKVYPEPSRDNSYLQLPRHFQSAFAFYKLFVEHEPPGSRILDIGAGSGVFCFICNAFGYRAVGLEPPDEEPKRKWLNIQLLQWYGVPLVRHYIRPMEPLPIGDGQFDCVTIMKPLFYRMDQRRFWSQEMWEFFFADLRRICSQRAVLALKMNLDKKVDGGESLYDHAEFFAAVQRYVVKAVDKRGRFRIDLTQQASSAWPAAALRALRKLS